MEIDFLFPGNYKFLRDHKISLKNPLILFDNHHVKIDVILKIKNKTYALYHIFLLNDEYICLMYFHITFHRGFQKPAIQLLIKVLRLCSDTNFILKV